MLGIHDPGIILGYLFSILGLVACVVYGLLFWNKGVATSEEIQEDLEWENKDHQLTEEI
ncbi:symporter small accessory protein [Maribellus sp. YY47]|uniref:symporter small accessory protein n=1 Tax=Maribellus sp. YY47 TaxID=2929486 RepID=UPI002001D462|nr:symporter small accessory protein [Maribellus sp. YY47]MCK3684109.1 hypothetical protein [Maribellus sp. YY47]